MREPVNYLLEIVVPANQTLTDIIILAWLAKCTNIIYRHSLPGHDFSMLLMIFALDFSFASLSALGENEVSVKAENTI